MPSLFQSIQASSTPSVTPLGNETWTASVFKEAGSPAWGLMKAAGMVSRWNAVFWVLMGAQVLALRRTPGAL